MSGQRRWARDANGDSVNRAASVGVGGGATKYSPVLATKQGATTVTAEEVK